MELYSGVRELYVKAEVIDNFYKTNYLLLDLDERIFDKRFRFPAQNEFIELKSNTTNQAAIGRVIKDKLVLINGKDTQIYGVSPRNIRQRMLFNILMDENIKIIIVTGRAGTGKSLLGLASSLSQLDQDKYGRLILTKPMSQVGKHPLGILPGEVSEKFKPYLDNYMDNIEHLLGNKYQDTEQLIKQHRMDFKPLQLIRGASWQNAFILADELQTLSFHEMVTLGTRVGEGSKIVIMGDMGQRDENIQVEKTGMHKIINDKKMQASPITASIQLEICERSEVAALFANIFEV